MQVEKEARGDSMKKADTYHLFCQHCYGVGRGMTKAW